MCMQEVVHEGDRKMTAMAGAVNAAVLVTHCMGVAVVQLEVHSTGGSGTSGGARDAHACSVQLAQKVRSIPYAHASSRGREK